jgi:monoamine oxidase
VQPRADPGTWQDAPAFTVVQQADGIELQVVSPLQVVARVCFITTPRELPAIAELKPCLDSSLKVRLPEPCGPPCARSCACVPVCLCA